ncbi:MAG: twin-arginine translocation signal domain-containing protein, partial [Thermodesulfovibrionales bacterium]
MVRITRRDFLKYCSVAAGALGLSASTLMKVEKVLANSSAPTVVWIAGSACTGCTMSLLNSVFYTTVDDLLLNKINLTYLDTAMATAGAYIDGVQYPGANALQAAHDAYNAGGYVLVVEGAIPVGTPTGGAAGDYCRIGQLVPGSSVDTMLEVTTAFAQKALAILAVGTCSSFGGIPGARGNVPNAKGVCFSGTAQGGAIETAINVKNRAAGTIAAKTFNISGCPPHPDWIVGTIAHILDTNITLPSVNRNYQPVDYGYKEYQCNAGPCPWRYNNTAVRNNNNSGTDNSISVNEPDYNRRYPVGDSKALGRNKWTGTDLGCLGILGCKGRKTKADCSRRRWNSDAAENYGVNWCVGSRAGC